MQFSHIQHYILSSTTLYSLPKYQFPTITTQLFIFIHFTSPSSLLWELFYSLYLSVSFYVNWFVHLFNVFFFFFHQLEANYFTTFQWVLSYIDMNQPWSYMYSPSRFFFFLSYIPHMAEIIWCLSFCLWLISFHHTLEVQMDLCKKMSVVLLLFQPSNTPLQIHTTFSLSIHLSIHTQVASIYWLL